MNYVALLASLLLISPWLFIFFRIVLRHICYIQWQINRAKLSRQQWLSTIEQQYYQAKMEDLYRE